MKILACIDVGDNKVTQFWDREDNGLVFCRLESMSVVLDLEKDRIKPIMRKEELLSKLDVTLNREEHIEALVDSIPLAYLGTLNIANAKLVPAN